MIYDILPCFTNSPHSSTAIVRLHNHHRTMSLNYALEVCKQLRKTHNVARLSAQSVSRNSSNTQLKVQT